MQFKTTLFNVFLATLTMSASAQHNCDVGDLGAIIFKKTNCESDDIKCVCSKTELLPELRAELTKRCSPEDGESKFDPWMLLIVALTIG